MIRYITVSVRRGVAAMLAVALASAASATETITYTYDAHGRLVQVRHAGSVNNGVTTTYGFDRAHNRTTRQTTGA